MQIYKLLLQRKIIRSRKIVGDIGEFYAGNRLNLILEQNKNSKGLDARDEKGATYEIKTRRVYDSSRRVSAKRRINNLVGKDADYLIVVTLNRKFLCFGMWIMPTKNIINPKSAKLQIINTTPGVKNLIPSQIPYLQSREPFDPVNKKSATKKKIRKPAVITLSKKEIKRVKSRKKPKREEKAQEDVFFTRNDLIACIVIIVFLLLLTLIYS